MKEDDKEVWCLTHGHWWYLHEQQTQTPEGYCYCCETKKPCDCDITEIEQMPVYLKEEKAL